MISYEIWAKQQHELIGLLWSFHYVLLLPLIACEDQHKAVWGNESQIESRNVFFFSVLPSPALFIQLLCRRVHKFCSRAICFSKAQYKCHTQGSEVQALVCLMHNLYWSTPSFVLSSWPHPQAHCLYQIIYPVQVISKRFSAVHYKYLAKTFTQHDYIHALLFLMLSKPQFNWE